ncbi:ABC transporter permease [Christensenellaceae bacterium OttesenSCG-928-M15]|nr:ABC transporter permease [Christensenellaceae bacterium OttesenSCG-928-M15]
MSLKSNGVTLPIGADAGTKKKEGRLLYVWRRFKKNKSAMIGLVIFLIVVMMALTADLYLDYIADAITQHADVRKQPPSAEHPFGTDQYGRDLFARIVYGARMSILISFSTTAMTLVAGSIIGAIAGFYGGRLDNIIMRVMDMLLAIPAILLAITVMAALGPSLFNLILALTISGIPANARFLRSLILSIRDQEYIEAARAVGTSDFRIITRHILPNTIGPLIVNSTLGVASIILSAAGLSFIGLGIQAPTPEWGSMLSGAREFIIQSPHLVIFPGIAIVVTVLSINMLGDGLRDALDPRLK